MRLLLPTRYPSIAGGKVEALRLLNPRPLGRVKGRALIFTSEAKRPMGGPEGYAKDKSVVNVVDGKKKEGMSIRG